MIDLNPFRYLAPRPRPHCFTALFLLAGWLALVTPLRADNPPTYLLEIDTNAVPGGIYDPNYVALDASNNIYVTDSYYNRVVKFAGNGTYLGQWNGPGGSNGTFYGPEGIALDSSNNVYVAGNSGRIEKFDSNGNYLTQWGTYGIAYSETYDPQGIAVDRSNNVYAAVNTGYQVQKFDGNGNYLTNWGGYGGGNGQFTGLAGIAVDRSNNVYVADQYLARVQKFDSNGNYLTQWNISSSGNVQFPYPYGVAVDSSNNVYVSESGNDRVEKFDSNGNYLTQWGSYGSGAGQFNSPLGIAVDSSGNFIIVADQNNHRIQVFVNNTNIVSPIVTSQPANQVVPPGFNVTFGINLLGTAPFAYQWTSNNVAVPGATNATFALTNVSLAASGSTYSVLVTNNFGTILSGNAVLTVLPVVAITQPASGLSATGAVLHGSVTVGLDETVAWFDWGTDTNYGNIAGITIVPGNTGSNNISVALSGLPGDFYHYRIVAANDLGIVYGNDQPFTVGFAPTATTLTPIYGSNGWTLNATVNPNGWDTTVYFNFGRESSYYNFNHNTTASVDIGAGTAAVNVSSFITGLTPNIYQCQVVASNSLVTRGRHGYGGYGAIVTFTNGFDSFPSGNFSAVASSADGRVLVAVSPGHDTSATSYVPSQIYISTNFGMFWTLATNAPTLYTMPSVACSADGSKIIAADSGVPIYTSSDTGATWVSNNAPVQFWRSVAISADGTKLVAAGNGIYTSADSGATWTQATNAPAQFWYAIAVSADGSKLAAMPAAWGGTNIYTSTDFGATWITNNLPTLGNAGSIASSADGSTLVAASYVDYFLGSWIIVSTNFGATWALTATDMSPPGISQHWSRVAASADGKHLAAVSAEYINNGNGTESLVSGGWLITSTNFGVTWQLTQGGDWSAVALTADGARILATDGPAAGFNPPDLIYVSQTTPSPELNLSASASDTAISWIIPSLDFTLQQSPDLSSWTDVTNRPVLNLTNLQNQVVLPPPNGNSFFRLTH